MKDCIFCQIVQGNIPCAKVYETGYILAFLDISPVIKGHTLVIPKKHMVNILDIPGSLAQELQESLQKVARGLMTGIKAQGFNVQMNNFEAAGQLVMHAHYHLMPRFAHDGLRLWPQHSYDSADEMKKVAQNIQAGILQA